MKQTKKKRVEKIEQEMKEGTTISRNKIAEKIIEKNYTISNNNSRTEITPCPGLEKLGIHSLQNHCQKPVS